MLCLCCWLHGTNISYFFHPYSSLLLRLLQAICVSSSHLLLLCMCAWYLYLFLPASDLLPVWFTCCTKGTVVLWGQSDSWKQPGIVLFPGHLHHMLHGNLTEQEREVCQLNRNRDRQKETDEIKHKYTTEIWHIMITESLVWPQNSSLLSLWRRRKRKKNPGNQNRYK